MKFQKRKQEEYVMYNIRLKKEKLSKYASNAEILEISTDELIHKMLDSGEMFHQPNFILANRERNIRLLDNMLTQIYPMLRHETHPNFGLQVSVFDKICTFHALMTAYFVQNPHDEINELIAMQAHEIIKYVSLNFKYDFKLLKRALINMPRTRMIKAIYKVNGKKSERDTVYSNNNGEKKEGTIVKQKYKKFDGAFGETTIILPPLGMTEKEFEAQK